MTLRVVPGRDEWGDEPETVRLYCFPEALLRLPDVCAMTGLAKTQIYERAKQGRFPRPVMLGPKTSAWRQSDIVRWIKELPSEPRG